MTGINGFNAIKYTTVDGEHCVATRNKGVITVLGDKSGVRQMDLNEFLPIFIESQQKVSLNNNLNRDIYSFSNNKIQNTYLNNDISTLEKAVSYKSPSFFSFSKNYKMTGAGFDVEYSDGFLKKRSVKGKIQGKNVDLKVSSDLFSMFTPSGTITGTIDGREVNITYEKTKEGLKMDGIQQEDADITSHLALLSTGRIKQDKTEMNASVMAGMVC